MVLNNKIRILSGIASFLMLTFCFSCEKTFPGLILCTDCLDNDPLVAKLEIKLSPDYFYKSVIIDIYEGNVEDSVLYKSYETSVPGFKVFVPINKKYTLVARYYIPDDYFLVVNSVLPVSKYDEMQCEKPCYYVVDNLVNLKLKHVK